MSENVGLEETVTLGQARKLIECLAAEQSILLLSPPGIGKSDTVVEAARAAGLHCKSLLGTQIAPEDVSGIPRIVGERSVFCPPRVLLPEEPVPFCLFLDELPACSPDIQKAFYSILLERRLGEHPLPTGTWVVAAGNRVVDRALVRSLSSALVNRVVILNVRVDNNEWLRWAKSNRVRDEVIAFILFMPDALMRPVPIEPIPFSTPRSWAALSRAYDLAEQAGILDRNTRRALAFGRLSPEDAAIFCAMVEEQLDLAGNVGQYIANPVMLPQSATARWLIIHLIRQRVATGMLGEYPPEQLNLFLRVVSKELLFALLVDLVPEWGKLGVNEVLLESLKEATGL